MTTAQTSDPGIRQCTSYEWDERYYQRRLEDPPDSVIYAPSLTHILGECYPGDGMLSRWRGDVGNERADVLLKEAGEEGTFVHQAIPRLFGGESIPSQDIREQFYPGFRALKVLRCVQAFVDWVHEWQVEPIEIETVTWCEVSPGVRFAGTRDLKCWATNPKKGSCRVIYLVDYKTGKAVYESAKAQVCGYRHSEIQNAPDQPAPIPGILHLGNTTKKRWSFNPLDDDEIQTYTARCLAAVSMWHLHHPDAKPNDEQFPEAFSLNPQEVTA